MCFEDIVAALGRAFGLDAAAGRFRLQLYESPDELSNDVKAKIDSFIETALFWSRAIAELRPAGEVSETPARDFHVMHV